MENFPDPISPYLECSRSELCLDHVLATGQVFRWKKYNTSINHNADNKTHDQQQPIKDDKTHDQQQPIKDGSWIGVIRYKLWILHQTNDKIFYQYHDLLDKDGLPHKENSTCSAHQELSEYFSLKHSLSKISNEWSGDTHLMSMVDQYKGLRILTQDPLECLIAFITSSCICNNIPRISSLMMKISTLSKYSLEFNGVVYYSIPSVDVLSGTGIETKVLINLGFGDRAKYIVRAASYLKKCGGESWLHRLREVTLEEAHESLQMLAGVGPKVASCVCLMSLNKHSAVPIDTHIYQVAVKYYNSPNKTLTSAMHGKLEKFFQKQHGPFAGWAQAYLFYSNIAKKQTNQNLASQSDDSKQPIKKEDHSINLENNHDLKALDESSVNNGIAAVKKKRKTPPPSKNGSSRKKR